MRPPLVFIAAATLAQLPTTAFAVDYLTAEQAAQAMFPDAQAWQLREIQLSAAQLQKLAASGVPPRSARWAARQANKNNQVLGWVITDDVLGKFELISYAVAVAPDGSVKQIEVLSYRESHGHEVRLPAWRKQFVGKSVASPLKLGDDIRNISGATLSCSHLTEGVRRIVAVVDEARRSGALPA
jgi:Na+-translocating ferredoxin:NAD+ oxidoreductase RnfG subunit